MLPLLAHGDVGAGDEISAALLVLAVIGYFVGAWIGDRRAKRSVKADELPQAASPKLLPPD